MRLAIVAEPRLAGLHGLEGTFPWGEARTFAPDDPALSAWEPVTVIALAVPAPDGPWRTIAWGAPRDDATDEPVVAPRDVAAPVRVGTAADGVWRRAPLPAADGLAALRERRGSGVLVVGREGLEPALVKLRARGVEARGAAELTREELERAAVVALLGPPGAPLPDAAPAVLAAGRILVAPRADPAFGLLPWSDHLPYENEDELACSADAAQTFPDAFEAIAEIGVLAAAAHLASAVYGRLAVDAELEAAPA